MKIQVECLLLAFTMCGSGCAVVHSRVPPAEYGHLDGKAVRAETHDGRKFDAIGAHFEDSTLVLDRALYRDWDSNTYPLKLDLDDVEAVEHLRVESLVYAEAGYEWGRNYGDASEFSSRTVFALEVGYLSGERRNQPRGRLGYGATFFGMTGSNDGHGGIKGRLRYRFNEHISSDIALGPMLVGSNPGTFKGFVASVGVNLGSYITFKSEYAQSGFAPWREYDSYGRSYVQHPAGTQREWYNGFAFRGGPAWILTATTIAVAAYVVASSFSALGSD